MNATAEQELVIPVGQLVRILLVEDEKGNADSLREVLESRGYSVQVASNPTDARLCLDAMGFGMLISDQVFDGYRIEGDSLLLDDQVSDIPRVLVTGKGIEGIRRKAELERRGIPILEKGHPDFHPRLGMIAHKALEAAKQKIIESVQPPSPPTGVGGASRVLGEARDLLLGWLRTRQDRDAQTIFYGGKGYSVNALIDEIEARTPVGEEHLALFIKVLRKAMRL